MEKFLFGFLVFERDGLQHIKSIIRKGIIETGDKELVMLTAIHHWLKEEKLRDEVFSTPLVPAWGLGFRISALKHLGFRFHWYNYGNNQNLILTKIPAYSTIKFCNLNQKSDIVILCPSQKERKQYFEVEERYKSSNRSYPIWHWMSISKKDILDYDRDDNSINRYLIATFDVCRNYRAYDPLLLEEELF